MSCGEEVLKDWISTILSSGCSCSVDPKSYMKIWLESLQTLATENPNANASLLALSSMNLLLRSLFFKPHSNETEVCRSTLEIVQIIKHGKFFILSILLRVAELQIPHASFVSHMAKELFLNILRVVPCPYYPEKCTHYCHETCGFFVRNVNENPIYLELVSKILDDSDSGPRLRTRECDDKVTSTLVFQSSHEESVKKGLVQNVKNEWKKWTLNPSLLQNPEFLRLWRKLVSIKSNLGVSSCRESITSSSLLVPDVSGSDICDEVWILKVSILNEVICYGSTLSLQSDVPDDICNIAQDILKEVVKANLKFSCMSTREFFIGDMGHHKNEDLKLDKICVQSFSLLVLKSIALVIRQATSCSSGEESDGSHCSKGSLCDLEADMIEKNMSRTLEAWQKWLVMTVVAGDPDQTEDDSFMEIFMPLFIEQDDTLIEALLCLLDIYVGFNALTPNTEETCDFHPILLFECFMEKCSWDSSVLVDYLISNETCFLLYFLRFLKFLSKVSHSSELLGKLLLEMQKSLAKLLSKGLFPYDVKPLVTLLNKINA